VKKEDVLLAGKYVRLEPLDHRHIDGLAAAAAVDRSLYQWSSVPQGKVEFGDAVRYRPCGRWRGDWVHAIV
jgi:hypothetical protein